MNDGTAIAIQNAAQIVESAAHVDVGNIDMPMLVRLWWLLKAGSFARRLTLPSGEQPCLLKNPPDARWADSHDIRVQHHERQPPVAFQRMVQIEPSRFADTMCTMRTLVQRNFCGCSMSSL